jgi:N-acetylglucosaminyldiphosphoundecaprenol N-acetyl-beta-D-mannosaminyltransferase
VTLNSFRTDEHIAAHNWEEMNPRHNSEQLTCKEEGRGRQCDQPVLPISAQMSKQLSSFRVLRSTIHAVEIDDVMGIFEQWISSRERSHYVALCNVHMVMEAYNKVYFHGAVASADLVAPDGMPLIWAGRRRGFKLRRRVYGPDLFLKFCQTTAAKGYRHFLFGGHPGVPGAVAARLTLSCPGIQIAGTYSPPFRKHTPAEHSEMIARINNSGADVLWVALGCPKQELWMYENRDRLNVPVVVGVGQAFDLYAGRVRQAPRWTRDSGLEWAFRLITNPRRLWRRYLVCNTQFLYWLALEGLGLVESKQPPNN